MHGSIGAILVPPSAAFGRGTPPSVAFQISPRDIFCAVTYIPQYAGYLKSGRELKHDGHPEGNILHVSHLKSKFDIPAGSIREYQ